MPGPNWISHPRAAFGFKLLAWIVGIAAIIAATFWPRGKAFWFELPAVLGLSGLEAAVVLLLFSSCIALPYLLVRLYRDTPRPITAILFLATLAVSVVRMLSSRYVSDAYAHAQPLVLLMLALVCGMVVEMELRRLSKIHLLMAAAALVLCATYWCLILVIIASV